MIVTKPSYYDSFRCIASACPDSCCKDWDVLLDEQSAARYREISGTLGARIRKAIRTEDGETYIAFDGGKCPFWQANGLCELQAELGAGALCETCTEYPRIHHDYGDFQELELELSCPEAARIILSSPVLPRIATQVSGGQEPEYNRQAMALLLSSRESLLDFLGNDAYSIPELLQTLLLYAYEVDENLNFPEDDPQPFCPEAYLNPDIPEIEGSAADLFAFFADLEILTPEWAGLLAQGPADVPWDPCFRQIIRYFTERYWLQAVSDLDLASRAKFIVVSCLMIRFVPEDLLRSAQLYSKEIENDAENMDCILDAAFTSPAFRDAVILKLLK